MSIFLNRDWHGQVALKSAIATKGNALQKKLVSAVNGVHLLVRVTCDGVLIVLFVVPISSPCWLPQGSST